MSSQIILPNLKIDPEVIEELTQLSREILRANGNKSWDKKISLITDDVDIAMAEINYPGMKDIRGDDFLGYCWGNGGNQVIWVRPRGGVWLERNPNAWLRQSPHWTFQRRDEIKTLCHEVAHALTANICHNHTWRRAHAILLPFWLHRLYDPEVNFSDLRSDIHVITRKYTRTNRTKQFTEIEGHMQAISRTWAKWSSRVI